MRVGAPAPYLSKGELGLIFVGPDFSISFKFFNVGSRNTDGAFAAGADPVGIGESSLLNPVSDRSPGYLPSDGQLLDGELFFHLFHPYMITD